MSERRRRGASALKRSRAKAVVIGDLHFPFHHEAALEWALERAAEAEPEAVVQVGDLFDYFSQSRFPRNRSVMTAAEEMERGREAAVQFWAAVQKRMPKAACYQLYGNHDERPLKRILESLPDLMPLVAPSLRGLHEFDGVTTLPDAKTELVLGGVVYQHGWRSRLGEHASHNGRPTVHGHTHHGGTWFRNDGRGSLWELDAGCLVDLEHEAFDYRIQKKLYGVTVGIGLIDGDGPRFIPFVQ